jgi:two-component system cell cycle sensor histidine kinase/response regulator CckA
LVEEGGVYRELFEQSPDAILIIEGDRFVDCNPAAVRMLRFPSREELLERYAGSSQLGARSAHPADLSPPRQPDGRLSREKAEELMEIAFERGNHIFEWTHLCADGEPLLVEVQLTVVKRGERPVLHVVWRDISDRKQLEADLRQAHRLEAVGQLAGGIAHDFNNLLVVIIGHAELLEEELLSGRPDSDRIGEIRSAAGRAASLTRQLLAFSQGQPAQVRATDMCQLIEQLSSLLRCLVGDLVELKVDCSEAPLVVVADPSQLEQVVVNLAANARDAMPTGGSLVISIRERRITPRKPMGDLAPGSYVALSVADSGEGMTHEQIERAFDPFFTTKSLGKGTGLGLATVHAIAKQNAGHASIDSALGRGTTVEVLLPLSDRAPVRLGQTERLPRAVGGGETILLVEDEPMLRDLFEAGLRSAGYEVLTARDGQEALECIEQLGKEIDLLATDVVMPRVSGPELVRRISRTMPKLKVLYMSGYSQEGNLSGVSGEAGTAVLQKPFSIRLFHSEVRRLLDA